MGIKKLKIGILGSGNFGCALGVVFSKLGHEVLVWSRRADVAQHINTHHENPKYLKGIALGDIKASDNLEHVLSESTCLISTIPTQFIRSTFESIKPFVKPHHIIINGSKGIENKTLMIPTEIFKDVLGKEIESRLLVLSGPTFAEEMARDHPTGAVIASTNEALALEIQHALSGRFFRLYSSDDVLGCELGGALKNVMAIGTGIAEGLGFGLNTRAAFITRCLHQMTALGVKMGAHPLTFSGLSGLGDLILTCTGDLSRNRQVGLELGRGKKLEEILKNMTSVAEGVYTTLSVHELALREGVDMPNAESVYKILYEGLSPKQALKDLLSRELKEEKEGIEE